MRGTKPLPRELRKQQIFHAAAEVFSEKGYRVASVNDIINRAGVARGTFYHYFESKKDIFLELVESYFNEFTRFVERHSQQLKDSVARGVAPARAWEEFALEAFRFHKDNPELSTVIFREAMGLDEHFSSRVTELREFARRTLLENLKSIDERGLLAPIDLELATAMIIGAIINVIMDYILRKDDVDLEATSREFIGNFVKAFAPEP